jgi:hypothetical protein
VWPSRLFLSLIAVVLQEQTPVVPTIGWEQIGVIGILITIGGLLMAGKLRLGISVDKETAISDARLAEQRASYEKQLTDLRADSDKRYSELVAQSNQRLADTITEWRARYAELGQDRDFWRQNALKPVEAVERLTDVVEALKKGLEHDAR